MAGGGIGEADDGGEGEVGRPRAAGAGSAGKSGCRGVRNTYREREGLMRNVEQQEEDEIEFMLADINE